MTTLLSDERELFLAEPAAVIDPATWRVFTVRQDQGADGFIEADLLRPLDWFGVDVQPGERWELDLGELGLAGDVEIVAIGECPPIEQGPGRVVLSTFRHSRGVVGTIRLAGQEATLRLTAGHPVWSNTRDNWAAAAELQPGEELRAWHGTAVVAAPWEPDGDEPVFNIEIDAEHVFRVGNGGLLVHNASAAPTTCADLACASDEQICAFLRESARAISNALGFLGTVVRTVAVGYANGQCKFSISCSANETPQSCVRGITAASAVARQRGITYTGLIQVTDEPDRWHAEAQLLQVMTPEYIAITRPPCEGTGANPPVRSCRARLDASGARVC